MILAYTMANGGYGIGGMSEHPSDPQGFGISADMKAYQVAEYRYRCKHQYAKWSSLPDDVKRAVIADCKAIKDSPKRIAQIQF